MSNAVIYARYSSDKQSEDSIEAQLRACRQYAATKGYNIVAVYADEAISGKGSMTASRAQYQKMLRDCNKGTFDTILIHKYDRVARSLGEHVNLDARLQKMGITLIAVGQDFGFGPESKIMRALMWSMSEYYIDNLANETKKGEREIALKGLHNGGYPPFGYDIVNQKYVINPYEAEYVRKIFAAVKNHEGTKDIIAEMAAVGIVGKRGKPLKYSAVYEILRNEKYTGTYIYCVDDEKDRSKRRSKPNAIRIENALPMIIDKATFDEVQKIMDSRKQSGPKTSYLCSGLVYCSCGAKMHAHISTKKGHVYHYYRCSKKCGTPMISMDIVDDAAKTYLRTLLNEENQKAIATAMRKYKCGEPERAADFKKIVASKISEKQKQYDTLMTNMSSGVLPADVIEDIGAKMNQLRSEIEALKKTEMPKDYTTDQISLWLKALHDSPDDKAIRLLISRIDIKNTTEINIQSTLTSVVGTIGCGSWI